MESRNQRISRAALDPDPFLQWGNRKRLRCIKIREEGTAARSDGQRRATSRINRRVVRGGEKEFSSPPLRPSHLLQHRNLDSVGSDNWKSRSASLSPEKEDRFYTTRGSVAVAAVGEENEIGNLNSVAGEDKGVIALPRFFLSLSNKEKEEDFMAMKGCKLPQRPKKRSKFVQKSVLLVSPGAWLSDLSQERYEVREKKSSRKRRRGLKALSMESDSE